MTNSIQVLLTSSSCHQTVSEWFLPQAPTYSTYTTTLIFLKRTHHTLSLLQTLTSFPSHNLYGKRKRLMLVLQSKPSLSTLLQSSFLILSSIIKKNTIILYLCSPSSNLENIPTCPGTSSPQWPLERGQSSSCTLLLQKTDFSHWLRSQDLHMGVCSRNPGLLSTVPHTSH